MEHSDFDQQLENLLEQGAREERARQPYTCESLATEKDSLMGEFFDHTTALYATADTIAEEELFQTLTSDEHEAMRGQLNARMNEALEQYDELRQGEVIISKQVIACVEVQDEASGTVSLMNVALEDEQYIQGDVDIYVVEDQPDLTESSEFTDNEEQTRALHGLWVKLNNITVYDPAELEPLYESRTALVLLSHPGVEMYKVLRQPERGPGSDDSFQPAIEHLINERYLQECLSMENELKYFIGTPEQREQTRHQFEKKARAGLIDEVEHELFLISTDDAYYFGCDTPFSLKDEALFYRNTKIIRQHGQDRVMHIFQLLEDDGEYSDMPIYIAPEDIHRDEAS